MCVKSKKQPTNRLHRMHLTKQKKNKSIQKDNFVSNPKGHFFMVSCQNDLFSLTNRRHQSALNETDTKTDIRRDIYDLKKYLERKRSIDRPTNRDTNGT
mmetsp:Transcript_72083/g.114887  ORF Transcript_72083/g.114887 Transcript_72083/m.114887 type:complete len:99 (-) Transcript_72083:538-834(-)